MTFLPSLTSWICGRLSPLGHRDVAWRATRTLAASAMLTFSLGAHAADMTITAEFKPTAFDPTRTEFTNTTPKSGYCAVHPAYCPNGQFSIFLPIGAVRYGAIASNAADEDAVQLRVPSEFREVEVQNQTSGERATVKFRVSAFSTTYNVSTITVIQSQAEHAKLWDTGTWVYAPPPCGGSGLSSLGQGAYMFMWYTPPAVQRLGCTKKPTRDLAPGELTMLAPRMSIGYELVAPDPLRMQNGVYRGSLRYTVGAGGDFSFGTSASTAKSQIDIDFELTVKHDFQLVLPVEDRTAVLEPPSGWGAWLAGGEAPPALRRDKGFQISVGAPFTVTLSCASAMGDRCLLSNSAGSRVPYGVFLTIPGIITASGDSAARLELLPDKVRRLRPAVGYVNGVQARLHVEAGGDSVREMVKYPGTRYSDVFTMTFDVQTN